MCLIWIERSWRPPAVHTELSASGFAISRYETHESEGAGWPLTHLEDFVDTALPTNSWQLIWKG